MQTQNVRNCDVLIIGSGAAGLATAVTASQLALDVIVCEQADKIGGSSALSGGEIWIPGSRQSKNGDTVDSAKTYLQNVVGDFLDDARVDAFLENASEALAFLEDHSHIDYELLTFVVDYFSELPGATQGERSLGVLPFDGRLLGQRFNDIRAPIPSSMILGGMALGREDVPHFSKFWRSMQSASYVAGMVLQHLRDRMSGHERGTRMVMGNALVGRMVKTLDELEIPIMLKTTVTGLRFEGSQISTAVAKCGADTIEINTKCGVVVASGGFSGSKEKQKHYFKHVGDGKAHLTPLPATNDGSGLDLILECGGQIDHRIAQPAAWAPMSSVPMPDGSHVLFPHFGDRAKPGVIAVNRDGFRFANEAINYHDFTQAILETSAGVRDPSCFLVTSHKHLRKYGLGRVPPFPGRIGAFIKSGYLISGQTISELANNISIDASTLKTTIGKFDEHAAQGSDPDFHKGKTDYQRAAGDVEMRPNPCVAPLGDGPYYAIRIFPGDIGTMLGATVDELSRVLGSNGEPIAGLFAVGTVASSIMGGFYPGAGTNLGPCLVSGYLVAQTINSEMQAGASN